MKKTLFIILMSLILLPLMAQSKKIVRITVERANIRQQASTESTVLLGVQKGTELLLLGKSGNWLRVELPGGKSAGYIHSSLGVVEEAPAELKVISDEEEPTKPAPKKAEKPKTSPKPASVKPAKSAKSKRKSGAFKKMYLTGTYGVSMQEETQNVGFTTPIYFETATFSTDYTAKTGSGFAALLGYRLSPALSVEVGADITSRKLDTLTGFSVPHPLWVGVLRGGELSRSGSLKENTFFLNLAYTLKFSALSLSLSAGPCMVMAQAELIDDFEYTEPAYPFSTVSVSAVTITEKQNIFGFNAGAALGYAFSDALSLVVNARFISAKMTLDGEGAGLIYPGQITLGGLRVGGGIQVSF